MARTYSWNEVKRRIHGSDAGQLLELIRDLYQLNSDNRRFLEARFLMSEANLERYRRLVSEAIFPDPFGRRTTSIAEAKRLIREYEKATGDPVGVIELKLTFLEQGTNQALEFGCDDDQYFGALTSMVSSAIESLRKLPDDVKHRHIPRLENLRDRGSRLGWGYGDFLHDALDEFILEERPD